MNVAVVSAAAAVKRYKLNLIDESVDFMKYKNDSCSAASYWNRDHNITLLYHDTTQKKCAP